MPAEAAETVFMWEMSIPMCWWIPGSASKRIEEGLKDLDVKGDELDGILYHEHADHIQGLGVFSRKYGIPSMLQRAPSRNQRLPES